MAYIIFAGSLDRDLTIRSHNIVRRLAEPNDFGCRAFRCGLNRLKNTGDQFLDGIPLRLWICQP